MAIPTYYSHFSGDLIQNTYAMILNNILSDGGIVSRKQTFYL